MVPSLALGRPGEGAQIELVDHPDHEPGQMILREPFVKTRRQQELLRPVTAPMGDRHTAIMTTPPAEREHPQSKPQHAQ
jgi:hypothetical protein